VRIPKKGKMGGEKGSAATANDARGGGEGVSCTRLNSERGKKEVVGGLDHRERKKNKGRWV